MSIAGIIIGGLLFVIGGPIGFIFALDIVGPEGEAWVPFAAGASISMVGVVLTYVSFILAQGGIGVPQMRSTFFDRDRY